MRCACRGRTWGCLCRWSSVWATLRRFTCSVRSLDAGKGKRRVCCVSVADVPLCARSDDADEDTGVKRPGVEGADTHRDGTRSQRHTGAGAGAGAGAGSAGSNPATRGEDSDSDDSLADVLSDDESGSGAPKTAFAQAVNHVRDSSSSISKHHVRSCFHDASRCLVASPFSPLWW